MRQAAADRAPVPIMDMAYVPSRLMQEWPAGGHDGRAFEDALPGHGADMKLAVYNFEEIQFAQTIHIDQNRWPSQPEVHHRHQALSSGKRSGRLTMLI